ncbi:unnamed protein product [Gadus morhua 'NCC']
MTVDQMKEKTGPKTLDRDKGDRPRLWTQRQRRRTDPARVWKPRKDASPEDSLITTHSVESPPGVLVVWFLLFHVTNDGHVLTRMRLKTSGTMKEVGMYGGGRELKMLKEHSIVSAAEMLWALVGRACPGLRGSLQRMQLDYVDVVFANRPDTNTPMEEIVRAMTHVINQGMSMYWGTSRWSAMEIMEAYSVARQFNLIPPVCEQAEYHFFQREKVETQLPELYHKIGVGVVSWSPLACGIITGKYDNGIPETSRASMKPYQWLREKITSEDGRKQQAKLKELTHIAEKLGCTLPQLAIAWCLRNEGVSSVLLGSSNPVQLTENLGAIQVIPKMTTGIASEVDNLLGNRPHRKLFKPKTFH